MKFLNVKLMEDILKFLDNLVLSCVDYFLIFSKRLVSISCLKI